MSERTAEERVRRTLERTVLSLLESNQRANAVTQALRVAESQLDMTEQCYRLLLAERDELRRVLASRRVRTRRTGRARKR